MLGTRELNNRPCRQWTLRSTQGTSEGCSRARYELASKNSVHLVENNKNDEDAVTGVHLAQERAAYVVAGNNRMHRHKLLE